jgi:CheY-like chemotaxis protein
LNAVKFTNPGGRIEARSARKGNFVEITIRDSGIGIEPEFLSHVFERFRQADSTSTRRYGGLGLGLAIVRYVVEMHGGSVSAFSAGKNHGSTFTIQFPIAYVETPKLQTRPPATEVPSVKQRETSRPHERLDGVRLLVVDDDPDTLELLQFVLKDQGATVVPAGSTPEALTILDKWQPDVLVSDIAMPDEDGYSLIAQVRSRGADRGGDVPAVALTAYARSEDRVRALSAGFQMYQVKPVEPEELVAVVASLSKRR